MQSKITPRDGNVESVWDNHGHRLAFEGRRRLARLRRGSAKQYAVVRFNCDSGFNDLSEGLLCNETMTWHSTNPIWIDGFTALSILRPMLFGSLVYEVEAIGMVGRGGGPTYRPLYRLVRPAYNSAATLVGDLTLAGSCVADTGISSPFSLGTNQLPVSSALGNTSGIKYRACNVMAAGMPAPLHYGWDATGSVTPIPIAIPASQLGSVAFFESDADAAAASIAVSGLKIDSGEPFDVIVTVTGSSTNAIYSNTVWFRGQSAPGSTTVNFAGISGGIGKKDSPAGQDNEAANGTTSLLISTYSGSMFASIAVTADATTKRVGTVTVSVTNASSLAMTVRGGSS